MSHRFWFPAVAFGCLLVGFALGWLTPRFSNKPYSALPDEPWEFDEKVLVIRTDPDLVSAAAFSATAGNPPDPRWIFSFHDSVQSQRTFAAARDAAMAKYRLVLNSP